MRIITILFLLFSFSITNLALSQGPVYILGYLYLGSDTLDIEDGGCIKTKVSFISVSYDSSRHSYLISGELSDQQSGELFNDSYGRIFLGKIDSVNARTWLGYKKTGLLVKRKQYHIDDSGKFSITIPSDIEDKIIFTGFGCNVRDYTISEILDIVKKQ